MINLQVTEKWFDGINPETVAVMVERVHSALNSPEVIPDWAKAVDKAEWQRAKIEANRRRELLDETCSESPPRTADLVRRIYEAGESP